LSIIVLSCRWNSSPSSFVFIEVMQIKIFIMPVRNILALIILVTLLVACGQPFTSTPTAAPYSGIEGKVLIGPMCPGPVPIDNSNCLDQPYQAKIVVLDSQNEEVITVSSDSAGYFKLPLPPGNYILHPISGQPLPRASDQAVTVNSNQYTKVIIQYDTGMR
jgi:hypothetical protein